MKEKSTESELNVPDGYTGELIQTNVMGIPVVGVQLTHDKCDEELGVVPKIVGADLIMRGLILSHRCDD